MKTRCLLLILLVNILGCSAADKTKSHRLVKRQFPPRPGLRAFPLSRSRQFPPPEELEESEEYVYSEDEEDKNAASPFRGRLPQRPPSEEDYTDDYSYITEAPKKTTPAPQKPTARTIIFNNRFAARPRFGSFGSTTSTTTTTTTPAPKPSTASTSRSRFRATPAQSQRLDVVANILNKPPPPRPLERSFSSSRTSNLNNDKKPVPSSSEAPTRRSTSRPRGRGRFRPRTTTSTTTTTTTTEQPLEEYYYYYEDEEDQKNQPIATTSTTTTTTPKPSLPKRVSINRRPSSGRSQSTTKPIVKFDPESQFLPPPEDIAEVRSESYSTKKFTTSSTTTPVPGSAVDAIPPHLRSKYKPRKDGRFIDFLRDPNRPRELKGFDLTDYPFYVKVPEDIDFECEDKKDGYYASVPHKCQLFHYCFAGARYDFLCANYTLYDQTTFTCRFANNVDCLSSEKYYYRNDDLWKETTTVAPETTTPKRRRTTPKDEDYDDYYDYDEYYDDEEERRRRPPKRRRNRRKNRRKPQE